MPEVPAVSRTSGLNGGRASAAAVREAFSETGALARVLDGYEPRDGQRRMAEAVAHVVEDGGTLLAEAGTGTGKTLAYLIPAILSGHRVLVSTGTKNLQEQIFFKDLPALQEALGVAVHGDADEGPRQLPVPAPLGALSRRRRRRHVGGRPADRNERSRAPADHRRLGRRRPRPATAPSCATCPRTFRSGTRSPPRPTRASAPSVRATANASSRACASAPPSPTSSSSTTICCARMRRCGRATTAK